MKTIFLTVCSLLLGVVSICAVPKKSTGSWIDEAVKAKMSILADLQKNNMPVVSTWVNRE